MAAPGITIIKSFTYRDDAEEYSNTYHFVGDAPSTPADWRNLADDLISLEVHVYDSAVTVVRALCYEDTDDDSVYTYHIADFMTPPTGLMDHDSGSVKCPGDDAVWASWDTGKRNTRGKPIWLRKYFHPAWRTSGDVDAVDANQKSALDTFEGAVAVTSGDWPGIADPEGDAPTGGTRSSAFVTTRTLKRRGRRPPP